MPDVTLESATDCFLSYVRADNDVFGGVVDRLKRELEGAYEAHTGRRLRVFVDRDDIGWGDDWRQAIRVSIERATVFIPVITMRYFASSACVDELTAFYSNAEQLGVTELLMPIVLAGEDLIESDDPREEVRLIERLNQKRLGGAWRAGYDSPEWRAVIYEMVQSLARAIADAENRLAEQEARIEPTGAGGSMAEAVDETAGESQADVSELFAQAESLAEFTNEVSEALAAFGEAAEESIGKADWASLNPQQLRSRLMGAAAAMKHVSADVGDKGLELQRRTAEFDANLRATVDELRALDVDTAREQLAALIGPFTSPDFDLAETVESMDQLDEALKFASLMNVTLRKALRPGIQGSQSIKRAAQTVDSWKRLL